MIFQALYESAQRGELILVDGGFLRFHLRRDGQITIHEIISLKRGAGTQMLNILTLQAKGKSILAKCPADLPSNDWYLRKGFIKVGIETTRSGREVCIWRKSIE